MRRRAVVDRSYLGVKGNIALWYAFLGAPIAWVIELFFIYFTIPYACVTGRVFALYAFGAAALALSLGSGFMAYLIWMDTDGDMPGEEATRADRSRLMAVIGVMSSALFSTILAGQLIAIGILGPCIPIPRERFTPDAMIEPAHIAPAGVHS